MKALPWLLSVLLFLLVLALGSAGAPEPSTATPVGRFQLCAATITETIVDFKDGIHFETTSGLFRIDTRSGQVHQLGVFNYRGQVHMSWQLISEETRYINPALATNPASYPFLTWEQWEQAMQTNAATNRPVPPAAP